MDNVVDQIEQRFQNLNKLKLFELISRSRDYERAFPGLAFSSIKTVYGQHFNIHRLNSELHVYYSNENLRNKNVSELLLYLKTTSIGSALYELTKLCELIVTIPATSASVESSFSTLERIKAYAGNSHEENIMSRLSLLSIEKKLLEHIRSSEDFYDRVINDFAAKDRIIDLLLK